MQACDHEAVIPAIRHCGVDIPEMNGCHSAAMEKTADTEKHVLFCLVFYQTTQATGNDIVM